MIQDTHRWVTIHDVAATMGLVLTDRQAWAVGRLKQAQFRWEVGTQPLKDNRAKKSGAGSHCFALYPNTPVWRERIERAIRAVQAEEEAQLSLDLLSL